MHVDLTAEEAAMVKGLLRDTLPDRHELVQREELCERLIARLESEASRTASGPPM